MNYLWSGKPSLEAPHNPRYSIVLYPIPEITPEIQRKISIAAEMPLHDIRARVRKDGYITILSFDSSEESEAVCARLSAGGISAQVFSTGNTYEIPDGDVVHTGKIENDYIIFSSGPNTCYTFTSGDRLLAIGGRVEEINYQVSTIDISVKTKTMLGVPQTYGAALSTMAGAKPLITSMGSGRFGVLDIYNIDTGMNVRIVEGLFNFREFLSARTEYNYIANERLLMQELRRLAPNIAEDRSYEESSLPYASQKGDFAAQPGNTCKTRHSAAKNDIDRFSHYSRFRFIMERGNL